MNICRFYFWSVRLVNYFSEVPISCLSLFAIVCSRWKHKICAGISREKCQSGKWFFEKSTRSFEMSSRD